jgi:Protein of unknown function (DUF2630)
LQQTQGINRDRTDALLPFCLVCASNLGSSPLFEALLAIGRIWHFDFLLITRGASQLRCERTYMAIEKNDQSVLRHIDGLVQEEERLFEQGMLTDEERGRLTELKAELDQYWDLLRQRRALREFGQDPGKAKVRPSKVVENYEQ